MRSTLLWFLWLITPVFALAFHYGPGQTWLARDRAAAMIRDAERQAATALDAQDEAYQTQLDVLSARREAFRAGVDWQSQTHNPLSKAVVNATKRQEEAYEHAAALWDQSTELYREAADELLKVEETSSNKSRPELSPDDLNVIESLRWAEARAMVRAGEVFNGVNQLDALMTYRLAQQSNPEYTKRTERPSSLPLDAIREELAAAQYVGARLLREEGRPPEVWRPLANSARQHYRYLASATGGDSTPETETPVGPKTTDDETKLGRHNRFQRNLEQVLNLEQSVTDQLEGIPLPRRSPLARRAGDGEPGDGPPGRRPGRGPLRDGPPNNGAGVPGPMGRGW
ncbi:MAG: hypothetical protein AAFX06_17400 [Planctomycetota bacterium]